MFYYGNGSYFDNLRDIYGEMEAFARYQKKLGQLLVATANEDGSTRVFVRSINPITDARQKNGWWNTFTITNKPCNAGTYICKVDDVRSDKNGYPIFVVHPVVSINESIIACNELMYIFGRSGMFVDEYNGWNGEYNHGYFESQIKQVCNVDLADDENQHIAVIMEAVRLFINGKITCDQIVAWLHEPTEWQKEQKALEEEVDSFFKNAAHRIAIANAPGMATPCDFTLTAEKCLNFMGDRGYIHPDQKVEFINDLLRKYECAVSAGQIPAVEGKTFWHQIESYLVFDKARKEAQKAAKTAAKKAKKAAAKNCQ